MRDSLADELFQVRHVAVILGREQEGVKGKGAPIGAIDSMMFTSWRLV